MSNINHEFERYWESCLSRDGVNLSVNNAIVKEFCRQMFVDIIVDIRGGKNRFN